jgi:hypothetical protein
MYRVIPDDSSTFHSYLRDLLEREAAFRLAGLRVTALRVALRPDCPRSTAIRPRTDDALRDAALALPTPPTSLPPTVSLLTIAHVRLDASFRGMDLPW